MKQYIKGFYKFATNEGSRDPLKGLNIDTASDQYNEQEQKKKYVAPGPSGSDPYRSEKKDEASVTGISLKRFLRENDGMSIIGGTVTSKNMLELKVETLAEPVSFTISLVASMTDSHPSIG